MARGRFGALLPYRMGMDLSSTTLRQFSIAPVRANITETMLEKLNLTVRRDDVIANGCKGYHLADWLQIEDYGHHNVADEPEETPEQDDRQQWILNQLRSGNKVTRSMVEDQFNIGSKQAKRELSGLTQQGLAHFIRKPWPGHYILCQ